jgi:hypothetical protein
MPTRLSAPTSSHPKVLAEWLERRTGSRNSAITLVTKLFDFYANELKENQRAANRAAASDRTRDRRAAAGLRR